MMDVQDEYDPPPLPRHYRPSVPTPVLVLGSSVYYKCCSIDPFDISPNFALFYISFITRLLPAGTNIQDKM